jgi:hypothetical protein
VISAAVLERMSKILLTISIYSNFRRGSFNTKNVSSFGKNDLRMPKRERFNSDPNEGKNTRRIIENAEVEEVKIDPTTVKYSLTGKF